MPAARKQAQADTRQLDLFSPFADVAPTIAAIANALHTMGVKTPVIAPIARTNNVTTLPVGLAAPSSALPSILLADIEEDEEVDREMEELAGSLVFSSDEAEEASEGTEDDPDGDEVKKTRSKEEMGTILQAYMRGVGRFSVPTPEQELELTTRYAATGDPDAYNELVVRNLRLVVREASKRMKFKKGGDSRWSGTLDLQDLINEGNMGLMHGITKFEPSRGNRLSTYVTWWINQHINNAVSKHAHTIATPKHVQVAVKKMRGNLAKAMHSGDAEAIEAAEAALDAFDSKRGNVNTQAVMGETVSLDAKVGGKGGDEGSVSIMDMIVDDCADPEAAYEAQQIAALIRQATENVCEGREKEIFYARNGLHDDSMGEAVTLIMLSEKFGLSRERINQISWEANRRVMKELVRITGSEESLPFKVFTPYEVEFFYACRPAKGGMAVKRSCVGRLLAVDDSDAKTSIRTYLRSDDAMDMLEVENMVMRHVDEKDMVVKVIPNTSSLVAGRIEISIKQDDPDQAPIVVVVTPEPVQKRRPPTKRPSL
jgi:RNA polymerase nonessential primary-like sigma factor